MKDTPRKQSGFMLATVVGKICTLRKYECVWVMDSGDGTSIVERKEWEKPNVQLANSLYGVPNTYIQINP